MLLTNLNKLPFSEKGQGLVFDDMNFSNHNRTTAIHLVDIENDRDMRILFGIHTILAGTPKIMCTNEALYDFLPLVGDPSFANGFAKKSKEDEAILRRITHLDLTKFGKLYS